jgi:hypothetical protein
MVHPFIFRRENRSIERGNTAYKRGRPLLTVVLKGLQGEIAKFPELNSSIFKTFWVFQDLQAQAAR